jgi:hypothetical protein
MMRVNRKEVSYKQNYKGDKTKLQPRLHVFKSVRDFTGDRNKSYPC